MTDTPQTWETEEEALAALHAYASQYAERQEDPQSYDRFLEDHQLLELQQGLYCVALKTGRMPLPYV